jgi:hypothetical protein
VFHALKTNRSQWLLLALLVLPVLLAACNAQGQASGSYASVPAGKAYAEGKEIFFTHTEASDAAIADTLTNMMKSPVLYVPSLANVPAESLASVYVFENGLAGKGPLGFQADVFDNPPGTDGYSPLRQVVLVKWAEGEQASEFKSEAEIEQAQAEGKVTTTESGVVVNMPFIVWDGGKR